MKLHPKIREFISLINEAGINKFVGNEKQVLTILKNNCATQTEAVIVIHLGFGISLDESESIVFPSKIWEREDLQDIAYQTFLYMNYNPADSDFSYNDDNVKFPLFTKDKKNE
jgi:hypothetical protein